MKISRLVAAAAMSCLVAAAASSQDKGNPEKLVKKYLDAVKVAPDDADNWYNLALAYKQLKKWTECGEAAQKLVALKPDDAAARFIAGEAMQETGKTAEAVAQFEQAVKIDPALAQGHVKLGDAYYAAGRYDDSVSAYKAAIKADANLGPSLYDDMGAAYLKKGDVESATRWLGKTVEASPNDPAVHYNLGVTYRKLAEENDSFYAKAADSFAKSADLDPKDAKTALLAAEAAFMADRKDQARLYLDRYFKIDPDGRKTGAQMHDLAKAYRDELGK